MTYLTPHKLARLKRAAQEVMGAAVPGSIAEFRLALGGSAVVLARLAQAANYDFAGFDVFSMIPPPSSPKDDEESRQRYRVLASGKSTGIGGEGYYGYRGDLYAEVCATFESFGLHVDGDRISLRKGLFEDTIPGWDAKAIAFAHLDCDGYDPVQFCLSSLWSQLSIRGRHRSG